MTIIWECQAQSPGCGTEWPFHTIVVTISVIPQQSITVRAILRRARLGKYACSTAYVNHKAMTLMVIESIWPKKRQFVPCDMNAEKPFNTKTDAAKSTTSSEWPEHNSCTSPSQIKTSAVIVEKNSAMYGEIRKIC